MDDNKIYISTKKARQLLGITTSTLINWDKAGKINTIRTPSGLRLYNSKDIQNIIGCDSNFQKKRKIAYCRVSSKKQINDLERQKDFFRSKYPDYELVEDVGSGINWKRKGLKTILDGAMSRDISEVVVAHRDRLCRFGFELLEWIFERNGIKLTVLDRDEHKSPDQDIADDIISIIHVYSRRQMGKRRYSVSKDSNLPESKSEEHL
jgi:predicted site-specific integrase-resolvase